MTVRSKEAWWIVAVALVASGALGIRLVTLGSEPFWLDEVCTRDFNAGTLVSVVTAYAKDVHPPLYGVLLRFWQSIAGDSEQALRGYSSLWSMVGLLFAVFLTRDVSESRLAALVSGLLMAVNPLDIWYAQEARMYAQAAGLIAMASWVLCRWLQRKEPTRRRWHLATAYGLLATLLLYTHYVTTVVLASQVLVVLTLFFVRRRWRDAIWLVGAASAAGVLFVPWVAFVHRFRDSVYSAGHVGWIPAPHLVDVLGYLNHEFFLGFGSAPPAVAGWFAVVVGAVLGVVVTAAASAGPASEGQPSRRTGDAVTFLLGLAIGPSLLAAAVSGLWHPIFFRPRFSLFCLIGTVVVLVVLLTRVRPPLRTLLAATVAALMAAGTAWQTMLPTKKGLRELAQLARTFGEPEFAILLPAPHERLARYYLPQAMQQPSAETLKARLRSGGQTNVWVCFEGGKIPPPGSPDGDLVAWLATTGPYRLLGHADDFAVYELHARLPRPDQKTNLPGAATTVDGPD